MSKMYLKNVFIIYTWPCMMFLYTFRIFNNALDSPLYFIKYSFHHICAGPWPIKCGLRLCMYTRDGNGYVELMNKM